MSAIAGILYGDGRPVPDTDVSTLSAHSRASGPDGGGTYIAPGLVMQAHILRFDRLSGAERQPYQFAQGSVLTWDGRLDNREDLLVTLNQRLGDDVSDAALVAAAYERWGLDVLPRLLGDWSLAIWDGANRSLLLARDFMGNRPLYYVQTNECLAWATCLDALLDRFDLYRLPSDEYLVGSLTYGVSPDITPFQSAHKLRAGHRLVAFQGRPFDRRRYWIYEAGRIRYRRNEDYIEHLRALLTESVRVRLRADRTVWSHLSGGWDSSSLVCLAHALIRCGQVEAPALQPISGVSSDSPESDESSYIAAVERWCDLRSVRHEFGVLPPFDAFLGHRRPNPYLPNWAMEGPIQSAGDRVLLSGELGDAVMLQNSQDFVSLLEPLYEGHPFLSLRLCASFARHRQDPIWPLLRRLVRTYRQASVREAYDRRRRLAARARHLSVSARNEAKLFGVPPGLLARASKPECETFPFVASFPHVKQRLVENLYRAAEHGALSNSDLLPDVRYTYPYTHRPLVEFILATPQLAFWNPVVYRLGMHRALHDVLPPEILGRTSKGNPNAVDARRIKAVADELNGTVTEWQLVQRGYVDGPILSEAIDKLWQGSPWHIDFVEKCRTLEGWLRSLSAIAHTRQPGTRDNDRVGGSGRAQTLHQSTASYGAMQTAENTSQRSR